MAQLWQPGTLSRRGTVLPSSFLLPYGRRREAELPRKFFAELSYKKAAGRWGHRPLRKGCGLAFAAHSLREISGEHWAPAIPYSAPTGAEGKRSFPGSSLQAFLQESGGPMRTSAPTEGLWPGLCRSLLTGDLRRALGPCYPLLCPYGRRREAKLPRKFFAKLSFKKAGRPPGHKRSQRAGIQKRRAAGPGRSGSGAVGTAWSMRLRPGGAPGGRPPSLSACHPMRRVP